MSEKSSITISRTIYDPDVKGFVTSSPDAKALPNVKEWINQHNPFIYWYVLRIDNLTDASIDQWAVELYAHQALTITEAYIDGSDRKFELRKEIHDTWTEKCVLSVPKQIGIPIVGKGIRRIYFKVDINCKEGLMHEYGISGKFMAQGMEPAEIKEKIFKYSCKVGEFRQIFDKDPQKALEYAEKKLAGNYLSSAVHVFTNSFRIIHELYGYCHSKTLDKDDFLQKLHLLQASFENVPEIAGKRITPLINDGIWELNNTINRDDFAPRSMKLCDALVELLHIEAMDAERKGAGTSVPPAEPVYSNNARTVPNFVNGQMDKCAECDNIISESNKSLICMGCSIHFCHTCEEWFRKDERKRGEGPLCKKCYTAEQNRLGELAEREEIRRKAESDKKASDEAENKKREEKERLRREQELQAKVEWETKKRQDDLRKRQDEDNKRLEKEREELKRKEEQERLRRQKKEQERIAQTEHDRKEKECKAKEEKERAAQETARRGQEKQKAREGQEGIAKKKSKISTSIFMLAIVLGVLFVGFVMFTSGFGGHTNSIGMEFVLIPAGEFNMGSPSSEEGRNDNEGPLHNVKIEKAYYLGKYEVTQKQWSKVMGDNPSSFKGDDLPVDSVLFFDVLEFIRKLNYKEGTDKYRLPSEAEWEYAARAGTTTRYSFGDSESMLGEYAWYDDNSDRKSHPVGQKKPNFWGLYDIYGNVWEWVDDDLHDDYAGAPIDGSAWASGGGSCRMVRGGSWSGSAQDCRSAFRSANYVDFHSTAVGFRLLQEL